MEVLVYHNYAERKYNCLGHEYSAKGILKPTKEELELARKSAVFDRNSVIMEI